MLADAIPAEFWGLLSAVIVLASTVVVALVRQLEQTTQALESLQNKMIDQAVPALERSTMAGQAMGPLLQQNAEAMGAMVRATDDSIRATENVVHLVEILRYSEGIQQPPPPRRPTTRRST